MSGGYDNQAADAYNAVGGGLYNNIYADYSSIGGGSSNTVLSDHATIGSGYNVVIDGSSEFAYVGTGGNTLASGYAATIIGGEGHNLLGGNSYGVLGGGRNATQEVGADYCTTLGGQSTRFRNSDDFSSYAGVIVGGEIQSVVGSYNTLYGTYRDEISDCDYATITGGAMNTIGITGVWTKHDGALVFDSSYSTIGCGVDNKVIDGTDNTIGGGQDNFVYGYANTIRGGLRNRVHGDYGFIFSGTDCTVGGKINAGEYSGEYGLSSYGVLMGGSSNTASGNVQGKPNIMGDSASVGVVHDTYTEGVAATVVSGQGHEASPKYMPTIMGGYYNSVRGNYGTVIGGARNKAFSNFATVLGGYKNKANGRFSTIIGGSANTVNGRYSVAFGYQSKVTGDFSAAFSLGAQPCEVTTDNTFAFCVGDLVLNEESVVDAMSRRRRALAANEDQLGKLEKLSTANEELQKTLDANNAALLQQEKMLAELEAVLEAQATARATAEKRLDSIRRLAVSNLNQGPPPQQLPPNGALPPAGTDTSSDSSDSSDEVNSGPPPVQVSDTPDETHVAGDDPGADNMAPDTGADAPADSDSFKGSALDDATGPKGDSSDPKDIYGPTGESEPNAQGPGSDVEDDDLIADEPDLGLVDIESGPDIGDAAAEHDDPVNIEPELVERF